MLLILYMLFYNTCIIERIVYIDYEFNICYAMFYIIIILIVTYKINI
jgi:hypothetical protein